MHCYSDSSTTLKMWSCVNHVVFKFKFSTPPPHLIKIQKFANRLKMQNINVTQCIYLLLKVFQSILSIIFSYQRNIILWGREYRQNDSKHFRTRVLLLFNELYLHKNLLPSLNVLNLCGKKYTICSNNIFCFVSVLFN